MTRPPVRPDPPRLLTDAKPEPKLMTREQLAAIYGTRHADAVMGLRAIKRRAE